MKVLYVTANVLGDAGANAAEIFPRQAIITSSVERVFVADYGKNRSYIREKQFCDFLRLRRPSFGRRTYVAIRNGFRISKKSIDEGVDVIHVFYRQKNIPLIVFLRIALFIMRGKPTIIVDHRSVNLSRGRRAFLKKTANFIMQIFTHHLAGNPWAVETNHFYVFKPRHIIDLGYDSLPVGNNSEQGPIKPVSVWFIGSLKPKNRKSEFLIEVFSRITEKTGISDQFHIRVAGPANSAQKQALCANPNITYYGRLPRAKLYELMRAHPGVGMAYMNLEFHAFAPSLKFCEYAIMRYCIVASDTVGLRMQADRMNLDGITFAAEEVDEWAEKLLIAALDWKELAPIWVDAPLWSYASIFQRQVVGLYEKIQR
jgi:hypothetical protein